MTYMTPRQSKYVRDLLALLRGLPEAEEVRDALNEVRRLRGAPTVEDAHEAIQLLLRYRSTYLSGRLPARPCTVPVCGGYSLAYRDEHGPCYAHATPEEREDNRRQRDAKAQWVRQFKAEQERSARWKQMAY